MIFFQKLIKIVLGIYWTSMKTEIVFTFQQCCGKGIVTIDLYFVHNFTWKNKKNSTKNQTKHQTPQPLNSEYTAIYMKITRNLTVFFYFFMFCLYKHDPSGGEQFTGEEKMNYVFSALRLWCQGPAVLRPTFVLQPLLILAKCQVTLKR